MVHVQGVYRMTMWIRPVNEREDGIKLYPFRCFQDKGCRIVLQTDREEHNETIREHDRVWNLNNNVLPPEHNPTVIVVGKQVTVDEGNVDVIDYTQEYTRLYDVACASLFTCWIDAPRLGRVVHEIFSEFPLFKLKQIDPTPETFGETKTCVLCGRRKTMSHVYNNGYGRVWYFGKNCSGNIESVLELLVEIRIHE